MAHRRLSPLVYTVLGMNPSKYSLDSFTLDGTNTYIVGTGRRRLLIDAGQGEAEYLTNLRSVVSDVLQIDGFEAIVLTHSHIDHIGGVPDVLKTWGQVPILKFRENEESDEVRPLARYISDGEVIRTEGASLRVIHTPG